VIHVLALTVALVLGAVANLSADGAPPPPSAPVTPQELLEFKAFIVKTANMEAASSFGQR
jgi:hypothetical protein